MTDMQDKSRCSAYGPKKQWKKILNLIYLIMSISRNNNYHVCTPLINDAWTRHPNSDTDILPESFALVR